MGKDKQIEEIIATDIVATVIKNVKEEFKKIADEEVETILDKEEIAKATQLKKYTKYFLSHIKKFLYKIENYNNIEAKFFPNSKNLEAQLRDEGKSEKEIKEIVYNRINALTKEEFFEFERLLIRFQEELNKSIDQEIQIAFVQRNSKTGKPEIIICKETPEMLRQTYINGSHNFKAKFLDNMTKYGKAEDLSKISNIEKLETAYENTIQRGKKSWKRGLENYPPKLMVFYKPNNVWHKAIIAQKGDINEAFAAFALSKKVEKINWGSDLEHQIGVFLYYKSIGVLSVDNMSGMLAGDYENYQIKSVGSSVGGYDQFIQMAYALNELSVNQIASGFVKKIKEDLKEKASKRNLDEKVETFIKGSVEECIVKDIFDKI